MPPWNKYSQNPYAVGSNLEAVKYQEKEERRRKNADPKVKQKKLELMKRRQDYGKYVHQYHMPKIHPHNEDDAKEDLNNQATAPEVEPYSSKDMPELEDEMDLEDKNNLSDLLVRDVSNKTSTKLTAKREAESANRSQFSNSHKTKSREQSKRRNNKQEPVKHHNDKLPALKKKNDGKDEKTIKNIPAQSKTNQSVDVIKKHTPKNSQKKKKPEKSKTIVEKDSKEEGESEASKVKRKRKEKSVQEGDEDGAKKSTKKKKDMILKPWNAVKNDEEEGAAQ